jgi:hypothetical protein
MGKAKLTESQIQRQIVSMLSGIARENQFMFFSIPNENLASKQDRKSAAIRMNKLKGMGLVPGASDLVVVHDGKAYFLEVKTPVGKQSENQKNFMLWAEASGSPYAIVRSHMDVIRALKAWGIVG